MDVTQLNKQFRIKINTSQAIQSLVLQHILRFIKMYYLNYVNIQYAVLPPFKSITKYI